MLPLFDWKIHRLKCDCAQSRSVTFISLSVSVSAAAVLFPRDAGPPPKRIILLSINELLKTFDRGRATDPDGSQGPSSPTKKIVILRICGQKVTAIQAPASLAVALMRLIPKALRKRSCCLGHTGSVDMVASWQMLAHQSAP